jgi:hypothetical protein
MAQERAGQAVVPGQPVAVDELPPEPEARGQPGHNGGKKADAGPGDPGLPAVECLDAEAPGLHAECPAITRPEADEK